MIYNKYSSEYPRRESLRTEFCEEAEALLESEGLKSKTYETQIYRLLECCEQKIDREMVADAVGCSASYARRFSYDDDRGAYEKEWSEYNQREKVSPGTRTKIINRDGGVCLRCGLEDETELEVHHIFPVNKGGTKDDSNLATLCLHCHSAAHAGSKTSGRTAYAEGCFTEWINETNRNAEQRDTSSNSRQKKISDY